jgi:hypothetical protein
MNSDPLRSGKASLLPVIQGARDQGWLSQQAMHAMLERIARGDAAERARLGAILATAAPREWIMLDEAVRRTESENLRIRMPASPDTLSLGMASMGRDGYQRETATRALAAQPGSLRGPFLALRTADWVPQVAEAAHSLLDVTDAATLAEAAPVLIELGRRSRAQPLARFESRVMGDPDRIRALLESPDARTRRWGLDLAQRVGLLEAADLLKFAKSDPDPGVSTAAGLACLKQLLPLKDRELLSELLACGALVRRQLLDALPDDESSVAIAQPLLFDRSALVRAGAQGVLRRTGPSVAPIYREPQSGPRRRAIALFELGHVGDMSDVRSAIAGLEDEDPAIRRAAITCVRLLLADESVPYVVPLVMDSSRGVVREAERALRTRAKFVDSAVLWDAARRAEAFVRGAAYRLLRARGLVDRLEADLAAVCDEDVRLSEQGTDDLVRWLKRGAASAKQPSAEARARLDQRLSVASSRVDRHVVAELRFHLGLPR